MSFSSRILLPTARFELRVGLLALLVSTTLFSGGVTDVAAQCAGNPLPLTNHSLKGTNFAQIDVNFDDFPDSETVGAGTITGIRGKLESGLNAGIDSWNGGCPGGAARNNYPVLMRGGVSSEFPSVNIRYENGWDPTPQVNTSTGDTTWAPAETTHNTSTGEITITIYRVFGTNTPNLSTFAAYDGHWGTLMGHELGHALGLGHDQCSSGLMFGGAGLYDGTEKDVLPQHCSLLQNIFYPPPDPLDNVIADCSARCVLHGYCVTNPLTGGGQASATKSSDCGFLAPWTHVRPVCYVTIVQSEGIIETAGPAYYYIHYRADVHCLNVLDPFTDGSQSAESFTGEAFDSLRGPSLILRSPETDETVDGELLVTGWAWGGTHSLREVRVMIDGQPVQPISFQYGLYSPEACNSGVDPQYCDENSGFEGRIDISNLSPGAHTIEVAATDWRSDPLAVGEKRTFFVGQAPAANAASFVGHTLPTSMSCGEVRDVSVTVKNTGSSTWTQDLCYKLGAYQDSDPFFPTNVRWALPGGNPVSQDEQVTFEFTLEAPSEPGTYLTDWQMISQVNCGGAGWFGPVLDREVEVDCNSSDAATVVSHTLPSQLSCGSGVEAEITMRNNGTTDWTASGNYYLGAVGSDPLATSLRIDLPAGTTVEPGQNHTFTVDLQAGAAMTGSYLTDWRMFRGSQAFGATASRNVQVGCASDDAALQSDTIPQSIACMGSAIAEITMQNNGSSTWQNTASKTYYIGTNNLDFDPFIANSNDPRTFALPDSASVGPGGSHTFEVPLQAPITPGTYTTAWRMGQTEDGQFGDLVSREIDVVCSTEVVVSGPNGPIERGSTIPFGTSTGNVLQMELSVCNPNLHPLTLSPDPTLGYVWGDGFYSIDDPHPLLSAGKCTTAIIGFDSDTPGAHGGAFEFNVGGDPVEYHFDLAATVVANAEIEVREVGGDGEVLEDGSSWLFTSTSPGVPVSQVFEICNLGNVDLTIDNPTALVTAGNAYYTQVGSSPAPSIVPGDCSQFEVEFEVSTTGIFPGMVRIYNNDTNEDPFDIPLMTTAY